MGVRSFPERLGGSADGEDRADEGFTTAARSVSGSGAGQPVRLWETTRIEAFSDGVFAIAITVLVLEIRIDPSEFAHLAHALVEEWPGYLAYVTSFLTIGSVWIAHHNLFTRLRFADAMLLRLNLVLLMLTAFLPFPTGILAQALRNPSEEAAQTAVVFYGLTALAMEVLLGTLVHYADARPVLTGDRRTGQAARAPSRSRIRRISVTAGIYVLAIGVGLAFPEYVAVAYLVIAIRSVSITGRERSLIPAG